MGTELAVPTTTKQPVTATVLAPSAYSPAFGLNRLSTKLATSGTNTQPDRYHHHHADEQGEQTRDGHFPEVRRPLGRPLANESQVQVVV